LGCKKRRKGAFPPTAKFPFPETAAQRTAKKHCDLLLLMEKNENEKEKKEVTLLR